MRKPSPEDIVKMIDDSQAPLAEEEHMLSSIRVKIKHGERLTQEEEEFLSNLLNKTRDWVRAVQSSADTEPENTLSG